MAILLAAAAGMVGADEPENAPEPVPPDAPADATLADSAVEHRVALPPALREFHKVMSGDMREVESDVATLLDQKYLTGTWGGLRNQLNDYGIIPSATYVADIQGNPSGGEIHKVRYAHDIGVDLVVDFQRLLGWQGSHFHVSMSSRSGNNLSDDIGNVFTVAQACCQGTTRLVTLAWEQSLLEHRLNLRIGRISTGDDFLTSRLYWLFVNNGFDGNPLGVQINVPYFTYPNAAWGARVRARPLRPFYVAAGVYDGDENVTRNSAHGVDFSFGNAGVLLTFEAGYEPAHHLDGVLPGHYKVGGYYHTGRFRRFDATPGSNLPSDYEHGNGGYYVLIDQMVFREAEDQGLWPFVTLLFAPSHEISTFPFFCSAGAAYDGLVPGRDDDIGLFGVVYGPFSNDLRRSEAGSPSGQQDFELVLEWGYIIQLGQWLHLQPDIQYVINPGGTGNIPDAVVLGFQIAANL
jgi:porin